jgi:hypothetical protein
MNSIDNNEDKVPSWGNTQYKTIGRYLIHVPSLEKNIIKIYYKSNKLIPTNILPRKTISHLFKTMIMDILYDSKFSEDDYAKLEKPEQVYFDDIIQLTRANYTSNKNLRKHKFYNEEENKKHIDRFNLLKGQLIAGNDNPAIIKEMKKLILFLKMNKLLDGVDKSAIDEVMYYLLCI